MTAAALAQRYNMIPFASVARLHAQTTYQTFACTPQQSLAFPRSASRFATVCDGLARVDDHYMLCTMNWIVWHVI